MIRPTSSPLEACYALWIGWWISWWLAALWSSRAAFRARAADELPYRLSTLAGFFILFGVNPSHGARGPVHLWSLPVDVAWLMTALCLAGFLFCWWARIHLGRLWSAFVTRKADHHIVDTGPYGIVRHPIYTGIISAAVAVALIKGTIYALCGVALITFGFWIKARLEERFLREQLGADAYDQYRRRVPMLLPLGRGFPS